MSEGKERISIFESIRQLIERKIFWLLKKLHLLVDAAPSTRLLHVLRQPVFMTVRRGAFFYRWKGVKEYESEIYLPRLWDTLGL